MTKQNGDDVWPNAAIWMRDELRSKVRTLITIVSTRNILDCDQSNYFSRIILSHISAKCIHLKISKMLFEPEIAPLNPPSPKTSPSNQTWSGSDDRLRRYGHLKFFQDGDSRHLGFVRTGNSAIRSAVHEKPTLEPNMKWIGRPVAEIWPFEIFEMRGRIEGRSVVIYTYLLYIKQESCAIAKMTARCALYK